MTVTPHDPLSSSGLELTTSNTPKLLCGRQGSSTNLTEGRFDTTPSLCLGPPHSSCMAFHREAWKSNLAQLPPSLASHSYDKVPSKTSKQKKPHQLGRPGAVLLLFHNIFLLKLVVLNLEPFFKPKSFQWSHSPKATINYSRGQPQPSLKMLASSSFFPQSGFWTRHRQLFGC